MAQIYGIQLKDGSLRKGWDQIPFFSFNKKLTVLIAKSLEGKCVPVEIVISKPQRRANSAPKESK